MAQRTNPSRYDDLKPTEKYMAVVATEASGNSSRLLANLGVPLTTIKLFQANNPNNVWDACYNGLVFWLNEGERESGEPATFGTLFQALRESHMTSCVSMLVDKLDQRPTVAGEELSTQTTKQDMSRVLHFSQRFRDSLKVTGVGPMGRRLGQGSYAAVQEVEWRGTLCAAKVLHEILLNDDTPGGSQKFVADFENECITWSKLLHPRVVQFLGIYFQPGCTIPILLLEKMDTSLRTHLEEHSREECSLSDKIHILRQAVQGLAYLHSFQPPLVHHDLSPNNILLNRASNLAKLTDFGMTRIVDPSGGSRKSSMKGTLAFMPPEALVEPLRYNEKLDVFSFGNVIITTLTHAWPNPAAPNKYEGERLVALSEFERRQQNMIQFTEVESALFLEMVRSCLENRPNLRPTSLQLVDQMKQMEGVHPRKAVVVEPAVVVQIAASMKTLQLQPKVFRSNLARRDKQRSEKMSDLLFAICTATSVTIGREVYIAGAFTARDITTAILVQVYDIDNGKCRTLPPAPQYYCGAVAIQDNLVLIGGRDSSSTEITNLVSTWMTREERWTQTLPPMNVKRSIPGVLLLDSLLFVFGGRSENEKFLLDTFEVLDLNTNQWREGRGRLPAPMYATQVGLFRDHVMLVCGASTVGTTTNACYTVPVQALEDSTTNPSSPPIQWTLVQDTPYFNSALLTTSQDAVLIGGDSEDDQVTRAIHRFGSGSWELIGELSQPRIRPAVVADSERSFIVFSGNTDSKNPLSSLLKTVERISYDI